MALTDAPPDWARPGGPWDVPSLSTLPPPAIVDGHLRFTSTEVNAASDTLAAVLAGRGCGRDDIVAFHLGNVWPAIVLFHACWRLGAVALPLHHRLGPDIREQLLDRTGARIVFAAHDLDPPGDAIVVGGAADEFSMLLTSAAAPPITGPPNPAATAVLLATSGSTGSPKLVRHTHRGLHAKARSMVDVHGLRETDVVLMPAPLAHISGLLNGVLLPGHAGMTTILMDRWLPDKALDLIQREHVSFMIGPPTFFIDLLADPACTPEATSSLRLVSCGGSAVTPAFVRATAERLDAVVKRTYGSTEAPTIATSHAGDPPGRGAETDGRAAGEVELRVVVPGTDTEAPTGAVGELRVRGPEVFPGYLDAGANADAFDAAGWFRTGDLAMIDEAGWLSITGRYSDLIIRGGENVAPAAVESACAGLAGVSSLAVVGYPDERLGERVALIVEGDEVALDLVTDACRAAGLPRYAWPERVIAIDVMPRLAAGKPDRNALAALARMA